MSPFLQIVKKYLKILLLFFLISQISRLYFIIYNHDLLQNFFYVWLESSYHGLRLDLSVSAACTAPLLLIWFIEEISGKKLLKVQKSFVILTLLFIGFITIVDAELFRKWGNKFNSQVLVYVTHPLEMALSAGAVNWIKTIVFTILLIILLRKIYTGITGTLKQVCAKKSATSFLIILLMGLNFIVIRGGTGVATISQSSAIYSDKSIDNASAVNSLWNAVYYITTNSDHLYGDKLNYLSQREAMTLLKEQLFETPDSISLFNIKKPNILIVMLESFTANASKYFTGNNNCTPYLDNVAGEGLSFMKCYASGDRTEKGLVAVLSGYPAQPSSSIIVFPDKMGKLPSLSRVLKKEGYSNLFIYGGDIEFASMKSYLVVHRFDEIIDKENFKPDELTSKWGTHDEYLYRQAILKLGAIKKPFFSTIMSLSSHEPFDVPFKDTKLKKDEWYGLKNSIGYADICLFQFLENCKKQPWYNETIIVLVADHGHDIGLKDVQYFGAEKFHIPLIIMGGALKKDYIGKRDQNVVSQTMIPSFLLHQLGLPTGSFKWQTSAFNNSGFAQYHFNNGLGRVSNAQECIYENDANRCYFYKGKQADSLAFLNQGKAFQQELIKDFLSK